MVRLILASSSPRRRRLLADAGFRFEVIPPADGAEPETIAGLSPEQLVAELARLKAADVVGALESGPEAAGALVLAADTVAECNGEILGKPRDEGHARQMLRLMSGRQHRVLTGVCLSPPEGPAVVEVQATELEMSPLDDDWLEPFLASGGWRGKAGAFGYQDGLEFVRILRGSESNVVGLPMERIAELLAERGCFPGGAG